MAHDLVRVAWNDGDHHTPSRRGSRVRRRIDQCPADVATLGPRARGLVAAMPEQLPNLPIIVVTGADDVESLMLASFRGGARDFLRKPFTVDELRDAVVRVVPAALEQPARRGTPATAVARVVA